MNILIRQCKRLFYGIALSVYATTPVLAADIEIFTDSNSASSTAQPNVMFLMDSSDTVRSTDLGSGAPVIASYDRTVTYPTVNSFDVSRLYYKDDGVAPTTHNDSQTFNASAYQCDHAIVDYQLNDITTGYLTSSSVSTPSKFVVDFLNTTTTVTVTATGSNGEGRDIRMRTTHDNFTPADLSDDVVVTDETLSTTTGEDSVLGTIATYTDAVSLSPPGSADVYKLTLTTTISGTGTGIDQSKGGARDVNFTMVHDNSTSGSTADDVQMFNTTEPDIPVGYGPIITAGFYSGQHAHVKPGPNSSQAVTWRSLDTNVSAERSYPVECRQDQDIHGHNTVNTTTQDHIALEDGDTSTDGWAAAEDAALIASLWSEASDNFYTIYHPNYLNYLQQATPIVSTANDSLFQMMKNAIATIVASASNVNIGIMQFDRKLNNSSSVVDDGLWVDADGDTVVDNGETGNISDNDIGNPGKSPNNEITGGEGAGVQYPSIDVNASRQNFYSRLSNMGAEGDAPISEVYLEALRYFGGELIDYGDSATPPNSTGTKENGQPTFYDSPIDDVCQKNYIIILSNGLSRYDYLDSTKRDPADGALVGFDANSCGNTGGVDSTHKGAGFDDTIDATPTITDPATRLSNSNLNAFSSDAATDDNCLDELAGWAFTEDIARRDVYGPNTADYTDRHVGEQSITTYTVGFAFPAVANEEQKAGEQLLRDTAAKGGGEFIEAADEDELVEVINSLLTQILKVNSTFSSPAVSVNAFNRSTHLNDLYFTLFKPDDAEHWTGNLKKYKLEFEADGTPVIRDKNGAAAINDTTGFFNETTQSYWSSAIDGDEAGDGGAASLIGNTEADGSIPVRKVYTITGAYTGTAGVKVPDVTDLTDEENRLSSDATVNSQITAAEFDTLLNIAGYPSILNDGGGSPIAYRDTLSDWVNGRDVFDEVPGSDSRHVMGDPLHAEPALIQYGELSVDIDGNGDKDPDLVSFMATNDGYLHAITTRDQGPDDGEDGGTELWAFIPQEILPNLNALLEDDGSEGKIYGLDGSVAPWINDADKDGVIDEVVHTFDIDEDHVYLYFGMRRGLENLQTRNYIYALDVTKRDEPQFMWMIEAGTGEYDELGQTWSTINVENIKVDPSVDTQGPADGEMKVLMFGGGYDLGQDSATQRAVDSMGRALYIVDAVTGERLWSAGPPNSDATFDHDLQLASMLYSIPSRIKPLDINGDGFIDRLYFGDMGGQLWRFDIIVPDGTSDTDTIAKIIKGGRLADLAQDADVNANRRFFYPPDVAFIVEEGQGAYLSILAASGNRAHPLQTDTHDRMYMIRDKNIYEPPPDSDGDGDIDTVDYEDLMVTDASGSTDLHDATENLVTEGTADEVTAAVTELADRQGWFIDLSEPSDSSFVGEKALSEPLIFSSVAILSTFLPASAGYVSAALCEPNTGTAAQYFINIADGTPTYSSDDELGVRADRRELLKRGGIPPTPSIIITDEGSPTLCIGTECESANANLNITKTYWYEVENANATISP